MDGDALLDAIRENPDDVASREVYADWLEQRGDPRAELVRLELDLRTLEPDHAYWRIAEARMAELRPGDDVAWIVAIEPNFWPERTRVCDCTDYKGPNALHREVQNMDCAAWRLVLERIERAAADGAEELAPLHGMNEAQSAQIRTLPAEIGKLDRLKHLNLYGSHLVRLPPEIGDLKSLVRFTPYTSYRLHYLPYEITRCPALADSTISTRALYANHKTGMLFPALAPQTIDEHLVCERQCSICQTPFADRGLHRCWISMTVATDVVPLLVNACSRACIETLDRVS